MADTPRPQSIASYIRPTSSGRRGFQSAEPPRFTGASIEGREPIAGPGFWRPSRGEVFLVVPFSIPGPNHREGILVLHWNAVDYERSCHEYCQFLSSAGQHDVRVREGRNGIRVTRCRAGQTSRCSSFLIQAIGRVAYHRPVSLVDVTPLASP